METLEEIKWDVALLGTGLSQSLLALALSRSGKNVLHVDRNDYYGGAEAALSLQEVEAWVETVNDASRPSAFRNATLTKASGDDGTSALGFSRAYSFSLCPQLIYTRSNLLPTLVSSKVHAQLEFLAVGSWWIFSNDAGGSREEVQLDKLRRIPGGREDIFSDKSIDLRSSRSLMKFLKIAADAETHDTILEEWGSRPFPDYLNAQFNIVPALQAPLLALTSSPSTPAMTLTSFALPRIHRHLTSIGLFGPGFGAVLPKWGGLAEIAQVACRAGAVGGGVYVLNKGIESVEDDDTPLGLGEEASKAEEQGPLKIKLQNGEELNAHWLVGSSEDIQALTEQPPTQLETSQTSHSITIASSPLSSLFHSAAEGAPPPAATVVVFPSGSLSFDSPSAAADIPPVYLIIHSSDTGDCPSGQCIIYAQTSLAQPHAATLLTHATNTLLASVSTPATEAEPTILWTLHYTRLHQLPPSSSESSGTQPFSIPKVSHILTLPSPPSGLALDNSVLRSVREVWARINGGDDGKFMLFEEREGVGDEDENEEDLPISPSDRDDLGEQNEGAARA